MKFIAIFLVTISILAFGFYKYLDSKLKIELDIEDPINVEIPVGTNAMEIIDIFNEHDMLQPKWLFKYIIKVYAKYSEKQIFAGYYTFETGTTNLELLKSIYEGGKLRTVKVTIPEGLKNQEITSLLSPIKTDLNRFVELCVSDSLLEARNIPAENVLGYLMPETYDFFLFEKAEKVIDKLLAAKENIWTPENINKLQELNMTTHEVYTLASIVEAETPLKREAKTVAGLYLNRLRKGMLLQADPTVQFVMGEKRRVLYRDLESENPYNTYKHVGLPPGPINNPGKNAVLAVLNAEDHDYIFMVSTGDGSGRHWFSKTNAEHERLVSKYRSVRDSIRSEKSHL